MFKGGDWVQVNSARHSLHLATGNIVSRAGAVVTGGKTVRLWRVLLDDTDETACVAETLLNLIEPSLAEAEIEGELLQILNDLREGHDECKPASPDTKPRLKASMLGRTPATRSTGFT